MNNSYEAYTETYGFKDLKDKLDTYGIWQVLGEDPNCDFGGSHHQPMLGFFEGKLYDVIHYALTLKGFWTWGAGGNFKQIEVVKVDTNTVQEMKKLAEEKAELEERLAKINRILK